MRSPPSKCRNCKHHKHGRKACGVKIPDGPGESISCGCRNGGTGRPSKLTDPLVELLVQALSGGNFRDVACDYAGIGRRTVADWMAAGKRLPKSRFGAFRRRVLQAERSAEIRCVALVLSAAKVDARHAEWFLARKFPERWADRSRLQLEGARGGSPLTVEVRTIPEGEGQ